MPATGRARKPALFFLGRPFEAQSRITQTPAQTALGLIWSAPQTGELSLDSLVWES